MKKYIFSIWLISLSIFLQGQNPMLSEGWYRIPYANGIEVKITRDFVNHGNNGGGQGSANEGPMDMVAVAGPATIVAAADGIVIKAEDDKQLCGCHPSFATCQANVVDLQHFNGERTRYLHLAYNSVVVSVGDTVMAGQALGTEGDVGYTCGNGRAANNPGNQCSVAQVDSAGNCGRHLHFYVRGNNGNFVNPRICSPDVAEDFFIFQDDSIYTAADCGTSTCQGGNQIILNVTFDGVMQCYPATDFISTLNSVIVQNTPYTSIDFQAGNKITLQEGFTAKSGSFFRASIRDCANNNMDGSNTQ
jgi:hypothetical protein